MVILFFSHKNPDVLFQLFGAGNTEILVKDSDKILSGTGGRYVFFAVITINIQHVRYLLDPFILKPYIINSNPVLRKGSFPQTGFETVSKGQYTNPPP
jgi:hypothetical protein